MTDQATTTPEGWKMTTLGEVLHVKHGYAFSGEGIIDKESENILLTPGNFLIGGGWKDGKKFFVGEVPADYLLKNNDLVLTMTDLSKDGDTLGFPALIPNNQAKKYLHNQRVGLVEINESLNSKIFIYFLLRTPNYQRYIVNTASGSTVRHTSPTKIESYETPIPPLPEQRAIAAVLSSFDDKIELLREQNKTLEAIAQAIFKEWFVHFNFPNDNGKPYKASGGKMIDSELGEIPEGWRIGKIKDLVDILSGFAFSSSGFSQVGRYKLVTIKNVQDRHFDHETKDRLSVLPARMPEYCKLNSGDILLSLTGNVGRICLVNGDNFLLNQRVAKLKEKNPSDYAFAYLLFLQDSIFSLLQSTASGTAQQNLSPVQTKEIEILIADKTTLYRFGDIANKLIQKINGINSQIQTLFQLHETLLPRLMGGEVRVRGFNN